MDNEGRTPLYYAAKSRNVRMVNLLLGHEAAIPLDMQTILQRYNM